jgi:Tfp pilus assembly protein PilO
MDIRVSNPTVRSASQTSVSGSVFEIVFLIIVILVGYFYLVAPKGREHKSVTEQLASVEQKQSALKDQQAAFDKLVQELDSKPDQVAALEATLPLDSKPSRLYVLLENLIQATGLTTGSVSVDADSQEVVAGSTTEDKPIAATDHKVKPTSIAVSATGTIDQLSGLLRQIETSTRLLEVSNLDIAQGRGDQLVFKIGLKAYSYSPDPAAASAPAN